MNALAKGDRVRIIKPGLRETGSIGFIGAVLDQDEEPTYYVELKRKQAPWRGSYKESELEPVGDEEETEEHA